jgi:type II secretory pathway pseudopilin PulG
LEGSQGAIIIYLMFKFFRHKRKTFNLPAFSLIEIMAVILIVSLGLVGTVNLAVQNIQAQTINDNTLVAYQLAQEGLELARQRRDTNWIQDKDWLENLEPGYYCVDYRNYTPASISAINYCPLYLDENNHYYSPAIAGELEDSEASNFHRMVEIATATSSVAVKSTVSWSGRNGSVHNYTAETEFYNWY